jgi:hypothetical protein
MARWRSRSGRHAWQWSTPRQHGDRRGFPVPVPTVLYRSPGTLIGKSINYLDFATIKLPAPAYTAISWHLLGSGG